MVTGLESKEFIDLLSQLNTIPLRLILFLENHADHDGWIVVSEYTIREELNLKLQQFSSAIEQLQKVDLVRVDKDDLYLNYRVDYDKGFSSINLTNAFEAIKSMYKRRLLLFYYFLLSEIPVDWRTVEVERLYKNSLFADSLLICLFESFDDFMRNFVPLVEMGFLEVRLNSNNVILTKNTVNVREQLYTFCGKEDRMVRKQRITDKSDVHQIQIRVSEKVLKDQNMKYATKRSNSLQDLKQIAMEYFWSIDYGEDALKEIYKTKKELYFQYGNKGIKVYRESLRAFFEDELYEYRFDTLMVKKQFSRIIKDIFFAPRINT